MGKLHNENVANDSRLVSLPLLIALIQSMKLGYLPKIGVICSPSSVSAVKVRMYAL